MLLVECRDQKAVSSKAQTSGLEIALLHENFPLPASCLIFLHANMHYNTQKFPREKTFPKIQQILYDQQ